MNQWVVLLYVGAGGAIGACSRYLISDYCAQVFGKGFPYGTLVVNILGSFVMGILLAAINNELISSAPWRQLIGLGLLGALTTFSTFSMDTVLLMQQGDVAKAGLNILLNVTFSISAAWLGFKLLNL
ncbi:fluoride efflux transporter CrcB [Vibrio sp.]|nr:fluoride efflux transporter CrcB [Vibrio sp.]